MGKEIKDYKRIGGIQKMREIKEMTCQIKDELEGAKDYAKMATHYKEMGDTQTGKMYYDMANDELKHAMNIHGIVVKLIEEKRKTVTPPQYMLDIWKEEHDEYLEETAKTKYMLAEFAK